MSPIGPEHYELFEPLTGVHHNTVQQAHELKEEDEDGATWCTRYVFITVALRSGSSASRTEARLPFYLPSVFHSFAIACFELGYNVSPIPRYVEKCVTSLSLIFPFLILFYFYRHYLIAEKQLVGCTVLEIRLLCAVSSGKNHDAHHLFFMYTLNENENYNFY